MVKGLVKVIYLWLQRIKNKIWIRKFNDYDLQKKVKYVNVFTPTVPLIHMQVYIKFFKLAQRPYCFNNSKAINCALIDYTVDHVYSERVGAAKSLH